MIRIKNDRFHFETTKAALNHSGIATAINCAALALGFWLSDGELLVKVASLLCAAGGVFYTGRETCDLDKRYGWKLGPINDDGDQWNSAELILPLLTCAAMAGAVWMMGGV
ncbi:hypothetical protein J7400_19055 [Shimia sp. R9_2]|uniref:hypothetical protein n=1 Tax=Shimia sp. R9_2 TaxID=2821112 RepID=UPI001ADA21E0|nr:hypothetical protein [Shimia sp. R9_2]MBO9398777.1 hypothetical protein [Shimia sp. R9_2]